MLQRYDFFANLQEINFTKTSQIQSNKIPARKFSPSDECFSCLSDEPEEGIGEENCLRHRTKAFSTLNKSIFYGN